MTGQDQPATRWKPHRAGIRNIWEYDEQVFAFADGRMILRGPNGSGKSNALALIFPFLFDGTMSAAAMDPFAGGRSMKSLLLGVVRDDARSGFRHDQRLGYVWLEFVRPGTDGDLFLTIGCGARARAEGDAKSWFFVTDRRVGFDLDLAPQGTPLTRGRLVDEIGATAVHESAEDHRQSVGRALLGLEADKLAKLNQLIRALRRPQLAGKLNVDELSAVLSSGLPAVASATLDDIAASLDDLERVQLELAGVREALATVEAFLPAYGVYLAGEARSRAGLVLAAQRRLDDDRRDLRRRQQDHEALIARRVALEGRRSETETAQARSEAEREALRDSERFKGAQELEQEEAHAVALEGAARDAHVRRAEASALADKLAARAADGERESQEATTEAELALRHAEDLADTVTALWSLDAHIEHNADDLRSAFDVMVAERRDAIAGVRDAQQALRDARQDHRLREEQLSLALTTAEELAAKATEESDQRDLLREEQRTLVSAWLGHAPGLDDAGREELAGLVDLAAEGEPAQLGERYRSRTEDYRDGLREQRHDVRGQIGGRLTSRVEMQAERDAVAAEQDPGPKAPAWRVLDRSELVPGSGAPLWACCDFAPTAGLGPKEQAGFEAALEAAGLLDAWLSPDGKIGEGIDAWLRPSPADGVDEPTLASVLCSSVPEGSGLSAALVHGVLQSVRLGDVGVAVDPTGRFALGPLAGRAAKPVAEFIGATARVERRARRLAALDEQLAALDQEIDALRAEEAEVQQALDALDAAVGAAPDLAPLMAASGRVDRAVSRWNEEEGRAAQAATAEATAAANVVANAQAVEAIAGRRSVPASDAELDEFVRAVDRLDKAGGSAADARRRVIELRQRVKLEVDDAAEARAAAELRHAEAERSQRDAEAKRRRVETLLSRLGPDARSVFDELAQVERQVEELKSNLSEIGGEIEKVIGDIGKAEGLIAGAEARITDAEEGLQGSLSGVSVLRRSDVLSFLEGTGERSVGGELPLDQVEFARWLAERVGSQPDEADHQRNKKILDKAQRQLLDDLHSGYSPAIVHHDDLILVEITSDDRSVFGVSDLRDRLTDQVASMEQHLTVGDREIFEKHLLNRVSHELRRLLGEADEFVAGVNQALARTKTASGLQVELVWSPGGDDPEVRRALALLRRDTGQMGEDDRATLRRFFDRSIRRQRAEDPAAGYRANLEQVVDYRQWHRFQPFLIGPDGRAVLTRERFRGLSGGEQAVALHLPLFAAAAAHYDRAAPTAPRLVALDEAFAGIDEAMRGELLGLTVAFDLDVLLTGHELWGAYAEVPQIAVHDLLRRPPQEGVSVLTLRWDGHDLHEVPSGSEPDVGAASMPLEGLFSSGSDPS